MMEMAAKDIERLGGTVEMVDIGVQKVFYFSSKLIMLISYESESPAMELEFLF